MGDKQVGRVVVNVCRCTDLLENTVKPALNSIVDDPEAMQASVEALRGLGIGTAYPGHGRPFAMDTLQGTSQQAG